MFKRFYYLFIFLFFSVQLWSQEAVDINIEVGAPYPTELEYYLQNADNLFISSTNTTNATIDLYYHVRLIGDNGIDVSTNPTYKPPQAVTLQAFETFPSSSAKLSKPALCLIIGLLVCNMRVTLWF